MTDTTIGVDPANGDASAGRSDAHGETEPAPPTGEDDDAVASVLVPEEDGWTKYRLTPGTRLTVDGADGKPRAIVETDPEEEPDE